MYIVFRSVQWIGWFKFSSFTHSKLWYVWYSNCAFFAIIFSHFICSPPAVIAIFRMFLFLSQNQMVHHNKGQRKKENKTLTATINNKNQLKSLIKCLCLQSAYHYFLFSFLWWKICYLSHKEIQKRVELLPQKPKLIATQLL